MDGTFDGTALEMKIGIAVRGCLLGLREGETEGAAVSFRLLGLKLIEGSNVF